MSKQKKLHNRLNDLFSDLGHQKSQTPLEHGAIPGWTWECDSNGRFVSCSPEVKNVLGFEAQDFIGQDLTTYQLDPESTHIIQEIFTSGNFPAETVLNYQTDRGSSLQIRIHISRIESENGDGIGWRGFSQIIVPSKTDAPQTEIITPTPQLDIPTSRETGPSISIFQSMGIAVEDDQIISVSNPFTNSGEVSFQSRKTMATVSTLDSPATIAVPVDLPEQALGLLEIIDDTPNRKWSQDELRLAEEVADQLALALDNARLFQETQNTLSRTEALFNVSQASIAFENLAELLQSVVNTVAEALPADRALVAICDLERETINFLSI